jgi:4-hydroxyphenylpyruvate dioxygenase
MSSRPAKRVKRDYDKTAQTDLFEVKGLDHLEFTVCDAKTAAQILKRGLGMKEIAFSRKESGNHAYTSYILQTSNVKFVVNAPYLTEFKYPKSKPPNPKYDEERAKAFFSRHGNGVSCIGVEVGDAFQAYKTAIANGAPSVVEPTVLEASPGEGGGKVIFAEIEIYGDERSKASKDQSLTTMRFIQYDNFNGPLFPGYQKTQDYSDLDYGIARIDHVVGNVWDMTHSVNNLKKWIGLHTFANFTKEEIQTRWTSLNSEVLANNNLKLLLPINESAEGKKESQILEFLKTYNGPGVQHIALKTKNIFASVQLIQENREVGFEFIPTPPTYYEEPEIKKRMEEHLSKEEREAVKKYGILIDLDEEGVLLQIFTKPLFDRPTLFLEIIQRKCAGETLDIPGCGGFGQGNFKALFESIERMQKERGGLIDNQRNP